MRHVRLLVVVLIIALAGGAGGCTNPVKAWQSSLERYVAEQGHGDPNVLRRTDRAPSESDFGLIAATKYHNAGNAFSTGAYHRANRIGFSTATQWVGCVFNVVANMHVAIFIYDGSTYPKTGVTGIGIFTHCHGCGSLCF